MAFVSSKQSNPKGYTGGVASCVASTNVELVTSSLTIHSLLELKCLYLKVVGNSSAE